MVAGRIKWEKSLHCTRLTTGRNLVDRSHLRTRGSVLRELRKEVRALEDKLGEHSPASSRQSTPDRHAQPNEVARIGNSYPERKAVFEHLAQRPHRQPQLSSPLVTRKLPRAHGLQDEGLRAGRASRERRDMIEHLVAGARRDKSYSHRSASPSVVSRTISKAQPLQHDLERREVIDYLAAGAQRERSQTQRSVSSRVVSRNISTTEPQQKDPRRREVIEYLVAGAQREEPRAKRSVSPHVVIRKIHKAKPQRKDFGRRGAGGRREQPLAIRPSPRVMPRNKARPSRNEPERRDVIEHLVASPPAKPRVRRSPSPHAVTQRRKKAKSGNSEPRVCELVEYVDKGAGSTQPRGYRSPSRVATRMSNRAKSPKNETRVCELVEYVDKGAGSTQPRGYRSPSRVATRMPNRAKSPKNETRVRELIEYVDKGAGSPQPHAHRSLSPPSLTRRRQKAMPQKNPGRRELLEHFITATLHNEANSTEQKHDAQQQEYHPYDESKEISGECNVSFGTVAQGFYDDENGSYVEDDTEDVGGPYPEDDESGSYVEYDDDRVYTEDIDGTYPEDDDNGTFLDDENGLHLDDEDGTYPENDKNGSDTDDKNGIYSDDEEGTYTEDDENGTYPSSEDVIYPQYDENGIYPDFEDEPHPEYENGTNADDDEDESYPEYKISTRNSHLSTRRIPQQEPDDGGESFPEHPQIALRETRSSAQYSERYDDGRDTFPEYLQASERGSDRRKFSHPVREDHVERHEAYLEYAPMPERPVSSVEFSPLQAERVEPQVGEHLVSLAERKTSHRYAVRGSELRSIVGGNEKRRASHARSVPETAENMSSEESLENSDYSDSTHIMAEAGELITPQLEESLMPDTKQQKKERCPPMASDLRDTDSCEVTECRVPDELDKADVIALPTHTFDIPTRAEPSSDSAFFVPGPRRRRWNSLESLTYEECLERLELCRS